MLALVVVGCGGDDWQCAAPGGSIATTGVFELDYTGETASWVNHTLRAYVTVTDADTLEIWACQKRGDEMWTSEVDVLRPSGVTLPAMFGNAASAPRLSAWMTRYDKYQVVEEQLGDGLNAQHLGTLDEFDVDQGALVFDGTLREPCNLVRCQAAQRELVLHVDLTWTPR